MSSQEQRIIAGVYHLSKDLGSRTILDDVSLQVANGEFVFLVGPSGAGKSTLLKMMYMDDRPDTGQIVVGPFVSTRVTRKTIPALRRKIGIVFQDFRLIEDRTVFENIALAMKVTGTQMSEIKQRATEILTYIGLYHKRHSFPRTLSGGEQQRVAIARAVANRPAMLLADEPTGNLDSKTGAGILELFQQLHEEKSNRTIIMITHDEKVAFLADSIATLADGNITT
ncbi:MAG: ABC transporter ATP-binding protein [Victivallaceae bacterium]|nr:ABC transporter ATP-binding protein [Victivallaceae bacterium]